MRDSFERHRLAVEQEDRYAYQRWWRLALVRGREIQRQRRVILDLERRISTLEAELADTGKGTMAPTRATTSEGTKQAGRADSGASTEH